MVRPGFQKDGVSVSQIGIKMYVTIPELGVQVMFSGLIFSVEVPFSKFANNTEGQCGESRPHWALPAAEGVRVRGVTLGDTPGGRTVRRDAGCLSGPEPAAVSAFQLH